VVVVTSGIVQVGEHAKAEEADTLVSRQIDRHPTSAYAVFERLANFVRVAMEGTGETDSMAEGEGFEFVVPPLLRQTPL
jgi:hypothetical protein